MRSLRSLFYLILTLVCFTTFDPAYVQAQDLPNSIEGITEYKLENGMKVLLFPDESKPTIAVNITYLVGSRHENYGETGMAHLLEHLMFKGSQYHLNIPQEISTHGGRANGTTWLDRTNYYIEMPAEEQNLNWALELEADRMVNSFIAKKDLDSEMTVVRNEFESGENSPIRVLMERIFSTAYLWHNYGHSTIGARSDIENVPIDKLQAFYYNYYQPDNAVLVVAGNFNKTNALQTIQKTFGKITKPKRTLSPQYTIEPPQDGERTVTLKRVGDMQALGTAYHIPASAHPDTAAISVMAEVMGNTPSGRLYKSLVASGQAIDISAVHYELNQPGMLLFLVAAKKEQNIDIVKNTLQTQLEKIITEPVSETEVERAKNIILNNMDNMMNSPQNMGIALSEYIAAGDWRLFFLNRDRIKAVTAEDVTRVAKQYLTPDNCTVGQFIPTTSPSRVTIPVAPPLEEQLKELKVNTANMQTEVFDFKPATIDSRTKTTTLLDGVTLSELNKTTRGDMVNLHINLHIGNESSLVGKSLISDFTNEMLLRGSKNYSREQIADALTKWKATLNFKGNTSYITADLQVPTQHLVDALDLTMDILRNPSFDEKEFEQLKQQTMFSIEENKQEPQSIAFQALSRYLHPVDTNNIHYVMTPDESIAAISKITVQDLKDFHQEFYGANNMQIGIVGNYDVNKVHNLLTDTCNNWKSNISVNPIEDHYADLAPTTMAFKTPDKENAFFIAAQPIQITEEDNDYPALYLANYLLGGGFLDSRLATRVRQQEGLSYHVSSSLQADVQNNNGLFMSIAISAPQNVNKVQAAIIGELQKAINNGFTEQELQKAKVGLLQKIQVLRSNEASLANNLANNAYWHRTYKHSADFEAKIQALTTKDLQQALQKHMDVNKLIIIKAGDFKNEP